MLQLPSNYNEMRQKHPERLLMFYYCGDIKSCQINVTNTFAFFGDDARAAHKVFKDRKLEGKGEGAFMVFPFFDDDYVIRNLTQRGHKICICEYSR